MTDSESLTKLIEQFRSYPSDELLEMARSPNWALLTHQAVRGVLEERGIDAPPIPVESEAIPAPVVTGRDEQPSAPGDPARSDRPVSSPLRDSRLPPSPEVGRGRRRGGSSWQVWLSAVVALFSTCQLVGRISACAGEHGGTAFVEQEDESRAFARQQLDLQALREELERLKGDAPAALQEDGAQSTSRVTRAADPDSKSTTRSGEADPEPAGPRFQWRHGLRLSSDATISVLRASRLCDPEEVTETKNPFTDERIFVCPGPGYSKSGPVLPPSFIFQGAAVGSFTGTGKTEVITSIFGDDRLHKSPGASVLLAFEQAGWKSLFQDRRLSLSDCQKITAQGRPDRLLCVKDEGEAVPNPIARDASPPVTSVVLLSATESKFEALALARMIKGAIHCARGGSAGVEVTQLAQEGTAITATLERDEDRCPEIPRAVKLRWRLSGEGATPDKQSRKWLEQFGILPGAGAEERGE